MLKIMGKISDKRYRIAVPMILVVLITFIPISILLTQEEQIYKQNKKEIKLEARVKDISEITVKKIWVTTDQGKTWSILTQPVKWLSKEQKIIASFSVEEDGLYGFRFQFGDAVGNIMPEPSVGEKPSRNMSVLVDTTPPELLDIKQELVTVKAASVKIFYTARDRCKVDGLKLWVLLPGDDKWQEAKDLLTGQTEDGRKYLIYHLQQKGLHKFKLQAFDEVGNKTPEPGEKTPPDVEVEIPFIAPHPVISLPPGLETAKLAEEIEIKWEVPEDEFQKNSTTLFIEIKDGIWEKVAEELPNTYTYKWIAHEKLSGKKVRFKISVVGKEKELAWSEPTRSITIEERPCEVNIPLAQRHQRQGRIYIAQGEYEKAIAEYKEALNYFSSFYEALNEIGFAYYELKEYYEALGYFLKAKKVNASSPVPYINAALAYIKVEKNKEALEELKTAVALGIEIDKGIANTAADALLSLARTFLAKELKEEAKTACQTILNIKTCDQKYITQAKQILEKIK